MKGKYITTSLKLAVLAGSKNRNIDVKETKATLADHQTIWNKENGTVKPVVAAAFTELEYEIM